MKSDRNWVYFITRIIVTIYFTLYHRLSVYGKEKIPRDRPVIIASNHASYLDPPVVGYAFFPGYLKFIAWDKLFSFRPFGAFLRAMGSVPVSQQDKNSSAALLRLGYAPEDFCALATVAGDADDGSLAAGDEVPVELFREALEALDPEAVVLLDGKAAHAMREAYADALAHIEQFEVAMLEPGLVARVLGRRVLALGGFEASLADAASKQRVWAYLKQLPPLGSPY